MIVEIKRDEIHIEIFKSLYYAYSDELSQYSKRLRDEPVTLDIIQEINTNSLLKRYFLTDEKRKPIGFCLLGFDENTQPGTDWFIAEFYIQPQHRRKGYGNKAISELLNKHPGKYCYFVLKENKIAMNFWRSIRNEFKCIDMKNCYDASKYTPVDCVFEAFEYSQMNDIKKGNIAQ